LAGEVLCLAVVTPILVMCGPRCRESHVLCRRGYTKTVMFGLRYTQIVMCGPRYAYIQR
jgi:cytochrome c oxidase assembly factor CtaG